MTATWSWARMWQQIEDLETQGERWEAVCVCDLEGPDEAGNYDLIPNPKCPVHEGGPDVE